ncbi:MAG: protein-glutamate O-methyltransferase CheR [Desulfobacterales bacterium]|nr:protein-glutamate O-methyltransferase CheR [Desulfobacterales bacterium]
MMSINDSEFKSISSLIYKNFGINLTNEKKSLVVGRLQKHIRQLGFDTFQEYFEYVKADTTGKALGELINRISTNHTYFFRENDHFDFFSKVFLPEIKGKLSKENTRDLRIWSAGCSSGEEPYTFVILMMEFFGAEYMTWDAGILATDISAKALYSASLGIYPEERTTLIPPHLKSKYLKKDEHGNWGAIDRVKKEVTFRRFNLKNINFPFKKKFHLISCRNVMIYFDQPTREALVNMFYNHTMPGGYLFVGHSESLLTDSCPYKFIKPAIYRKN